ncbi:MAG: hypothetical protein QME57_03565 [Patescibacteria group bacterium]|nr:hypothetical protein [Patescibacteria group bacterium]
MRITFVYPDLATDNPNYAGYFHHGICFVSYFKKASHQTNLIQFTKEISEEEFQEKVRLLNPDLIGFSSTLHVFLLKNMPKRQKKLAIPLLFVAVFTLLFVLKR